ncbi:MAG: membrane protein insertase YidC [Verrucomicrobia bacterium]|nr:membrane protein insertase YidC [Verrucomicrobiota bacterium]
MDKRSILFVICVTFAFFGVHTWFGNQDLEQRKAYEVKMQEEKIARQKALEEEAASRTAKLEDLPLVNLCKDAAGKEKVASALSFGGHFVTLAWEAPLPDKLFLDGKSLQLSSSGYKAGEPVIYSKTNAKAIEVPTLENSMDLQLVALTAEPRVVLGEWRSQKMAMPYAFLDGPAIALYKSDKGFLPVGVVNGGKVKSLAEFERLKKQIVQVKVALTPGDDAQEEFYVLQNDYQQLVFSTRGGSLAEINLPFRSKEDKSSIVKEIDIDRSILKQSPNNARFPLHPYYINEGNGKVRRDEGFLGGYYPLLRRTQLNAAGDETNKISPQFYSLNIVGEDDNVANGLYRVTRFEPNLIEFQSTSGQRRITKTYFIPEDKNGPYCLRLTIRIDGDARGLWIGSGIPDAELLGGSYSPLLKVQTTRAKSSEVDEIDLPKKGPLVVTTISPNWISNSNGFLGVIMDPLEEATGGYKAIQIPGKEAVTRLSLIDAKYDLYPAENYPGYATYIPLKSGEMNFRIFAGPFDEKLLKQLDDLYEDPALGYNPDYASAQSIQGWFSFISRPFAKFLFFLMQIFYMVTRSWAASIILLTIALRAMMYPLNNWSIKSTIRMQEIAPKVKIIQEKNKKDPRKAQLEVMNLYKQEGVNPFTGCLPLLLQMPFLIGMFYLLKSSFPLRGAMFIPGWIDDLAAPDVLFSWDTPIWFIGNQFHLLPILMAVVMYFQQRLTSKIPKDPKLITDQQKQQKMMGNVMSIVFAVMFYNFPSGLNIYFMLSTLLGILQQVWITKKMQKK